MTIQGEQNRRMTFKVKGQGHRAKCQKRRKKQDAGNLPVSHFSTVLINQTRTDLILVLSFLLKQDYYIFIWRLHSIIQL